MTLGSGDGNVGELLAAARAAKHQATAAHVSASREVGREEEALAENLQQRLDIFWRGDAAKKNNFAAAAYLIMEQARIAFERNTKARFGSGYRSGGDGAERVSG